MWAIVVIPGILGKDGMKPLTGKAVPFDIDESKIESKTKVHEAVVDGIYNNYEEALANFKDIAERNKEYNNYYLVEIKQKSEFSNRKTWFSAGLDGKEY